MIGCFMKVCKRMGMRVNANKSKVMALGGEVFLDRMRLEHISEFKYLGCAG